MFVVQSGDVIATHRVTGEAGEGQEVRLLELCMLDSREAATAHILLVVSQVPRTHLLEPYPICSCQLL